MLGQSCICLQDWYLWKGLPKANESSDRQRSMIVKEVVISCGVWFLSFVCVCVCVCRCRYEIVILTAGGGGGLVFCVCVCRGRYEIVILTAWWFWFWVFFWCFVYVCVAAGKRLSSSRRVFFFCVLCVRVACVSLPVRGCYPHGVVFFFCVFCVSVCRQSAHPRAYVLPALLVWC